MAKGQRLKHQKFLTGAQSFIDFLVERIEVVNRWHGGVIKPTGSKHNRIRIGFPQPKTSIRLEYHTDAAMQEFFLTRSDNSFSLDDLMLTIV